MLQGGSVQALYARPLNHLGPFSNFALHKLLGVLRGHGDGKGALIEQALAHLGLGENGLRLARELSNHWLWRACCYALKIDQFWRVMRAKN